MRSATTVNAAHTEKTVRLAGEGLPQELDAHVSTARTSLGAAPTLVTRDAITLPPRSITTLVNGSYFDEPLVRR